MAEDKKLTDIYISNILTFKVNHFEVIKKTTIIQKYNIVEDTGLQKLTKYYVSYSYIQM